MESTNPAQSGGGCGGRVGINDGSQSGKNSKGVIFLNFAAAIAATAAGSSPTGATTKGGTNSHSTTSNIIIARPIATSSTPALRFHRGDGVLSAKSGEVAVLIGQIADRVLKYVGDRMPGLEALTISTLDTIFAPRLVLRYV